MLANSLMESFRRLVWVVSLFGFLAGCSTVEERQGVFANPVEERRAVFANLSPYPVSAATWKTMTGVYKGPVHSTAKAFGSTGVNVMEIRLELSGTPDAPLVYLDLDAAASSAWNMSVNYTEKFTNIPQRVYGGRCPVLVYSHAPSQLLISLEPDILSPNRGAAMILTFHGGRDINSYADVDYIGHFSRRGNGSLSRVPTYKLFAQ